MHSSKKQYKKNQIRILISIVGIFLFISITNCSKLHAQEQDSIDDNYNSADQRELSIYNLANEAYKRGEFEKALKIWIMQAEREFSPAQFMVGQMYYQGNGIEKNDQLAFKWFSMSAKQNHQAQLIVGMMYQDGIGVEKNLKSAAEWYTSAAEHGNSRAQLNLSIMYEFGYGVEQNNKIAYMWNNLCASDPKNIEKSKIRREQLEKKMTISDISRAEGFTTMCKSQGYKNCRFN